MSLSVPLPLALDMLAYQRSITPEEKAGRSGSTISKKERRKRTKHKKIAKKQRSKEENFEGGVR